MAKKKVLINRFYRCEKWKQARALKIALASGLCEKCGKVGEEVHHIKYLTEENVSDNSISISQDNLILLCKECHNKEHKRFKRNRTNFDENGDLIA